MGNNANLKLRSELTCIETQSVKIYENNRRRQVYHLFFEIQSTITKNYTSTKLTQTQVFILLYFQFNDLFGQKLLQSLQKLLQGPTVIHLSYLSETTEKTNS